MSDLHWLTAAELGSAYAARKVSPVELVKSLLGRIDALEPQLNAFIKLDHDAVLAQAKEAEREIRAGRMRGPLHGVPVGIKDIIDVAGETTTCPSKIFLTNVAQADAEVVRRLRAAGAILFGKLSLHEFAIGGPSFDLPFPARPQSMEPRSPSGRLLIGLRAPRLRRVFCPSRWERTPVVPSAIPPAIAAWSD